MLFVLSALGHPFVAFEVQFPFPVKVNVMVNVIPSGS